MEEILEKIKAFGDRAHINQGRKYEMGPYMVHPVRVMETCRKYIPELPVLAAALLHDVLEDTPVSQVEMQAFLTSIMSINDAERTLHHVIELTDIYTKSSYPKLNRRTRKEKEAQRLAKVSSQAQTIKYADIMDNSAEILVQDPGFARRYLPECKLLVEKMKNGHPLLRQKAREAVQLHMKKLSSIEG